MFDSRRRTLLEISTEISQFLHYYHTRRLTIYMKMYNIKACCKWGLCVCMIMSLFWNLFPCIADICIFTVYRYTCGNMFVGIHMCVCVCLCLYAYVLIYINFITKHTGCIFLPHCLTNTFLGTQPLIVLEIMLIRCLRWWSTVLMPSIFLQLAIMGVYIGLYITGYNVITAHCQDPF